MKRYIIILSFLFLTGLLYSQNFEIEWQQCFGGSESDEARDIVEVQDGYLIVGNTRSDDGDISFNHGTTEIWLIKTDTNGNLIWEKTYGGSKGEGCRRIIPDYNGNYFLLGGSNSSDGDISHDPYPDTWDFWIVKIDSVGTIIWDKIVGGNADETMWTGTLTDEGGIVAIGWSASDDGNVSIHYGLYDTWIVKLNSEGEVEWDFTVGTDWQDYGQAVIQTSDGGYLLGSNSAIRNGGNISCEPHSSWADGVLVKLDADRNIEWQQCYGGSEHDGILGILEIEEGYVFSAYAGSNDGDISGWHGEDDIWVVKIDLFGNIIWQKCLGGSRFESAKNIFLTEDEGFVLFGSTESQNGDVTGNHSLSEYDRDIWFIKLSSEGELLSQQCFGGIVNEHVDFGVIKKSDYNYVIAGKTDYGPSYDVQCTPHGSLPDEEFWVFEIKDTTVGIQKTPLDNVLKVYPNPANKYVVFETVVISTPSAVALAKAESVEKSPQHNPQSPPQITITNTLGQQIAQIEVKSSKTVLDTRGFKPGVYFYFLEIEGKRHSGKVVIQK